MDGREDQALPQPGHVVVRYDGAVPLGKAVPHATNTVLRNNGVVPRRQQRRGSVDPGIGSGDRTSHGRPTLSQVVGSGVLGHEEVHRGHRSHTAMVSIAIRSGGVAQPPVSLGPVEWGGLSSHHGWRGDRELVPWGGQDGRDP